MLKLIERMGRKAWKSENKITKQSHQAFMRMLLHKGHESVIEHSQVSADIVVDRGVTHEMVRHRIASFTQESTHFCDYSRGRFGSEISVICPREIRRSMAGLRIWKGAMLHAEEAYLGLIKVGIQPKIARGVLPQNLKADIGMTCNLREWRHVLSLRTSKAAHPQMRHIMTIGLEEISKMFPGMFDDIGGEYG